MDNKEIKMTDESVITFGIHKGEKLANIPSSYFIWLDKQPWCSADMKVYIKENMEVFNQEFNEKNKSK